MNGVRIAIGVEQRKAWASPVVRSAAALLAVGVTVMAAAMTAAARAGNEQIIAQLGPVADAEGWDLYLGVAAQVAGAALVLGFGVTLSWLVGREFADGTISALFALPVSRRQTCAGKLAVYVAWAAAVGAALVILLTIAGLAIGLGLPDAAGMAGLSRMFVLAVLSAGLAVPAAWAATAGRGLLPGIAATIGLVVVAQVAVVAELGAWLPLAAPAFWALNPAEVAPAQLALSLTVPLGFGALAVRAWRRLQLDR